jgi:uncharacterized membrane protein YedE/YeeE
MTRRKLNTNPGTGMMVMMIMTMMVCFILFVCLFIVAGHSNVFICFASFENPKTYQPAREKNKQEKITKSMQIF